MQQNRETSLPTQVAVGWTLILLVKTFSFSAGILFSILANDSYEILSVDPGIRAARAFLYVFWLLSLMPVFVMLSTRTEARFPRWIGVALVSALLFLTALHHGSHWHNGDRPDFNSHVIDLMNYGVGLWVLFNSIRWARAPAAASGSALR